MINFDDLRVEENKTYTVLPCNLASDLVWFFNRSGIKSKRLNIRDIEKGKNKEVSALFTKEKMYEAIKEFVKNDEFDKNPCILVTNFNSEDLVKKAMWLRTHGDKDLSKNKTKAHNDAMSMIESSQSLHGIQ